MDSTEQVVDKKRVFGGSWFLVIAPVFVCVFRIWYEFGKKDLFGQGDFWITVLIQNWAMTLDIVGWFIGGAILYYFASLVPQDVLVDRAENKDLSSSFGYFFNDSFKGFTVEYKMLDADGKYLGKGETHYSGIWDAPFMPLKLLMWILFLFAKASFVPYYAVFNFLRNYPGVWLFARRRRAKRAAA